MKWWAALVLAGCIGRSTISNPHEGLAKLEFHNAAGGPICELHVFRFGQTDEGVNRIAANAELPSGMHVDMWLTPNTYQVRAGGCPYEKQQVGGYVASEALPRDGIVVLFREDDAKSKATADALVHAHENSALMPAKLLFNASATKKPPNTLPTPGARSSQVSGAASSSAIQLTRIAPVADSTRASTRTRRGSSASAAERRAVVR